MVDVKCKNLQSEEGNGAIARNLYELAELNRQATKIANVAEISEAIT